MASMKSGVLAAQKAGVKTAAMQMQRGPKGGRFYMNAAGHKTYGEPPKGHAPGMIVEARAAAPKKDRLAVPPHITKGAKVQADLDGEGWIHGTVTDIYPKRGVARIRLADGSGDVESPFEATRAPKAPKVKGAPPPPKEPKPPKPEPPPKAPPVPKGPKGGPGPHIAPGKHVEVELEGEGWIRGRIHSVAKNGKTAHVVLSDGTECKAPLDTIRPAKGDGTGAKQGIDRFVSGRIEGNPEFKYQIHKAIQAAGFGPFLEKHPLNDVIEGIGSRRALGVYKRSGGGDPRPVIEIKEDMSEVAARMRATSTPHAIGPTVFTVNSHATKDVTADDLHHSTLIHEISHHLHLHSGVDLHHQWGGGRAGSATKEDIALDGRIHDHYRRQKSHGWVASQYAKTNHKEWFAESHTAYVLHKAEFKAQDPQGFALIQEWRKMKGMAP